uniref:Uncharacterized protein n=1 Tax=Rhizophora mucronata TaxID=61149 RepID=A0A2P2Q689_RHIMU
MGKEGRQRGMVRSAGSPKFAGNSRQPARWSQCHMQPSVKPKNRTTSNFTYNKGISVTKPRWSHGDVVSCNYYRTLNSRVADVRRVSGYSATEILDLLTHDFPDDDDDENGREIDGSVDVNDEADARQEVQDDAIAYEDKNQGDYDDCNENCHDDHMSFCELGFILDEIEGEEGWCLVAQS